MAFLLVVLLLLLSQNESASASKSVPLTYTNFIKYKCNTTTYPHPCLKTLLPYASLVKANNTKLCVTSLQVAIQGARNASLTVRDLRRSKGITKGESEILRDCINDLKDAVYELKETVDAMGNMGEGNSRFEWDNAKTYASAVITDVDTCTDEFTGRKVNPTVRKKIKNVIYYVTQLSSNALFFINHLYY